ncbi:MAG: hypothetical protein HOV80_30190 [Polyangiaceae bacterium]|nr:hypothetical protein [Polyangiaceae bacterium]
MLNPRLRLLLGISAVAAATAACGDDTGSGGAGGSPTTTSSTGTTVTSSSSGNSTSTHHMECTTAEECTVTGTACTEKVCEEGMCGLAMLAAGTPVPDEEIQGDCQRAVCDAQGNVISEADDSDLPDDDNFCTIDGCSEGAVTSTFQPEDTPCVNGGSFCDGMGTCVECNDSDQCNDGALCVDHVCMPASCMDGVMNGDETDEDCGGEVCTKCADTLMCIINDDCQSDFCHPTNLVCTAPACPDGFQNGTETDLDCGGPSCPDCADGDGCVVDGDCSSGFCNTTTDLCAQPSCMDGFSNGDETGVDCGGPTCGDCINGQACSVDGDCQSGACINSVCSLINTCSLATAQDLTAMSNVNVTFTSFMYTPKCIKVAQGASVTFQGSFPSHPLMGGYVDGGLVPAASGPFVPVTSSGTTKTFTMSAAGTFPYYCELHGLGGMAGAVFVVP